MGEDPSEPAQLFPKEENIELDEAIKRHPAHMPEEEADSGTESPPTKQTPKHSKKVSTSSDTNVYQLPFSDEEPGSLGE